MTPRLENAAEVTSDAVLIEQVGARQVSALESVYDRHAGFVMGVALRVLGNREEAEEVVQDVFLKLWSSAIRYDPQRAKITTWLFAVTRNRALDFLRRRASRPAGRPLEAEPPLADGSRGPEDDCAPGEHRAAVAAALARLPETQRQAIEFSFYRGFSHTEIARRTGAPVGTVKSRIHQGMGRLRQELERAGVIA